MRRAIILVLTAAWSCTSLSAVFAANPVRTVAYTGASVPGAPVGTAFQTFGTSVINSSGDVAFVGTTNLLSTVPFSSGVWSETGGNLRTVAYSNSMLDHATGQDKLRSFERPFLNDLGQVAFAASARDDCSTRVCPAGSTLVVIESAPNQLTAVTRSGWLPPMPRDAAAIDYFYLNDFNNQGEVVYQGVLQAASNRFGVWITNVNLNGRVVGRQGDHPQNAPPGTLITSISNSALDQFVLPLTDSGITSFIGNVDTPAWIGSSLADLTILYALGDSVPGLGVPAVFNRLGQPLLTETGDVVFRGEFVGSGISFDDDVAIFRGDKNTGFEVIVRKGDQAPGMPPNIRFTHLHAKSLQINESGDAVFQGIANTGAPNFQSVEGIWMSKANGELSLVADFSMPLPGIDDGAKPVSSSLVRPFINDRGHVGFRTLLTGSIYNEGIWIQDEHGQLQLVVRKGQVIDVNDGSLVHHLAISEFSIVDGRSFNAKGQLTFRAKFSDGTEGVFVSNLVTVPEPATWLPLVFIGVRVAGRRGRRNLR